MRSEKVSQFVIKLIKLTKTGELIWKSVSDQNSERPCGEIILDKIYEGIISEKIFHLYRYKYKLYRDENNFELDQRIKLELIDDMGNTDYEFEYDNSMNDLYDIVREQNSDVMNIVNDLLGLRLEIIKAVYYTPKQSKDVTEQIAGKVCNDKLVVEANNGIAGDPEKGVIKRLKIKYRYAGETLEKEVTEGQTMIIP